MGSKNCSCYDFVHQSYNIETASGERPKVVTSDHLPKEMPQNSVYAKKIKVPENTGESQHSLGLRPAA